jgi:hypothetical protein
MFSPKNGWVVSILAGSVLIVAAALKSYALIVEPHSQDQISGGWWATLLLINWEICLGAWLLSGWMRRAAWGTAACCFAALFVVSFLAAIRGETSCACFGAARVHPWLVATMDLLLAVSLAVFALRGRSVPMMKFARVVGGGAALAVVAVTAAVVAAAQDQADPELTVYPETVSLGTVMAGGFAEDEVMLINQSGEPLEIAGYTSTCECLNVEMESGPIPPGTEIRARITLDLVAEPDFRGRLRASIQGVTWDGKPAFRIAVEADVR